MKRQLWIQQLSLGCGFEHCCFVQRRNVLNAPKRPSGCLRTRAMAAATILSASSFASRCSSFFASLASLTSLDCFKVFASITSFAATSASKALVTSCQSRNASRLSPGKERSAKTSASRVLRLLQPSSDQDSALRVAVAQREVNTATNGQTQPRDQPKSESSLAQLLRQRFSGFRWFSE